MTMMKLTNDFHRTETWVRPAPDGTISARAAKRASAKLCGYEGCVCSDDTGQRPARAMAADAQSTRYIVNATPLGDWTRECWSAPGEETCRKLYDNLPEFSYRPAPEPKFSDE